MYHNLTPIIRLWNIKNKGNIKRSFYSFYFLFFFFLCDQQTRNSILNCFNYAKQLFLYQHHKQGQKHRKKKKIMWHEKLDPHEPILQIVDFSETKKQRNKSNAKIKFNIYIVKLGTKSEFYVQMSCMLPEKLWLLIFNFRDNNKEKWCHQNTHHLEKL